MCFHESFDEMSDMCTLATSEIHGDRVFEGASEMATLSLQPKLAVGYVLVEEDCEQEVLVTLPPSVREWCHQGIGCQSSDDETSAEQVPGTVHCVCCM